MHFYRLFIAFVLSLLALAVVPLCYSSTLIDRHHFDGHKVRIEINKGKDSQQEVNQWQLSLLLPEGFNDQNSVLCFNTPLVSADSNSIALLVTNNLSNYCYQLVIMNGEQTPVFQQASKNGTLVRLKSSTADKPELASITTHPPLSSKPHTTPLTLLAYTENLTDLGLETGKTRNNTRTLTGDKLAGNVDLSGVGNGGFFYLPPPPPWGGGGGWPSGLFEIDLVVLKPVISWLLSIGKDSASFEEQPSPARVKMTRVNADGSSSEAVIPVGWLDFLNSEQLTDVHFWNTLLQRAAIACPVSENLQWQLGCLKLFLERTALKTDRAGALKAGNGDGEPSGSQPDKETRDENSPHQKEQRFEPDGQESRSPGEGYEGRGGGDNRKNDNGEESEKNTMTQDLQELANQLIAIIESGDPDAVFKLREILDELDMPQRLQVLETIGTNTRGNPVTPLEAALDLRRSFYENSKRNRFIRQLIEATTDKTRTLNDPDILSSLRPIILPDWTLHEVGDNNLRILYKIVQDIIHRVNQSDQQPPIGQFEKCCFTEYLVQLFLLYSNPLESIRELLEKLSDSVISRDIMIFAPSLTFSIPFRDTFIQLKKHPSRHELARFSNELIRQAHTSHSLQVPLIEPVISHSGNTANDTTASNGNRFIDPIRQFNSYHRAYGSTSCSPDSQRYLQQGARPKRTVLANQQDISSQKRLMARPSCGDHQAGGAHNRSDLEVSGINQNFLSKHSTDGSLLIELKRRAQEKEEKKTQRIEALTEEVQGLRIENRELTLETQGLRMENRELARTNQDLMAESRKHWNSMSDLETQNQCLREHITKLYVDIKKQQELADYWIHQTAANLARQTREARNPETHSYDTARFASQQQLSTHNEETNPSNEPLRTSEQEAREPLCNHYQRLCRVSFECCAGYFPCHRCHNASEDCDVSDRKACEARKFQCSLCNYEGDITENSQTCPQCKTLMADYYCAKCKHFTSTEKKPYHCDQCGICRIQKDKSFHCDVCNVCLDIKLKDNHKCRENSGHDPCCICLEDAFSGCKILPCSHKIHKDCATAMLQSGIRTCPMCRHPLFPPSDENNN